MFIYKITNKVNGKIYIGQTINKPEDRFKAHIKEARNNNQNYLYRAMRKYGIENFELEVIDEAKSIDELNCLEEYYISKFNSTDSEIGYNMHLGGNNNIMFSPIIKEHHAEKLRDPNVRLKISNSLKEYRKSNPFSEEHRKNLSAAMMGNHNFGNSRTRCIPVFCIDEFGVKHEFDCIKNGAIWWYNNYKPFGDRFVLITLQRKINASISGKCDFNIKWYKNNCV